MKDCAINEILNSANRRKDVNEINVINKDFYLASRKVQTSCSAKIKPPTININRILRTEHVQNFKTTSIQTANDLLENVTAE